MKAIITNGMANKDTIDCLISVLERQIKTKRFRINYTICLLLTKTKIK